MPPRPARTWNSATCAEIVARHAGREGPLLPILHDVQAEFGCIADAAVADIAEALNLSRAEVHGVVTFYHDFHREPVGRRVVKLCQAEACQARGGRAVTAAAEAAARLALGATAADGSLTLEPVYCLGLCASGPAALVDGRPVGRLDADSVSRLVQAAPAT
jgi:formate dehydrogenase subunit gamma